MDFDSLKITAKINSGNYESKSYQAATPKTTTVSEVSEVQTISSANIDNSSAENNQYDRESFLNQLSSTIEVANESLKALMIKKEFSYRVHEETNRVIVDVRNSETGEIIKEIPSESDLDTLAKIQELAGLFVDEKR